MHISVKHESLAKRCEICHKDDYFDPVDNKCHRCNNLQNSLFIPMTLAQENNNFFSSLFCKIGFHKWHNFRWERFCLRCSASQHVWRIMDKSILWRDTNELMESLDGADPLNQELETPLPLLKWQCEHCHRFVMRIHPPGMFESCQYCGTSNYILREKITKVK